MTAANSSAANPSAAWGSGEPTAALSRIRRAVATDATALARTDTQAWHETYPGIVPQHYLDGITAERRRRYWRRALLPPPTGLRESCVFVAETPRAGIVGFGACGHERAGLTDVEGEFHALYLLRSAQGLGVGRRLMETMARELLLRDVRRASVWTLRDNQRARRFYEKMGGRIVAERTLDFGGTPIQEVAYRWSDIRLVFVRETTT